MICSMWLTLGKRLYNLINCIQKNFILKYNYVCHVKMQTATKELELGEWYKKTHECDTVLV